MTSANAAAPQRDFSVGRVLSTSFDILFRNIIPFTLVSVAALLPIVVAFGILFAILFTAQSTGRFDATVFPPIMIGTVVAMFVLMLIFYPASAATLVYATFQHMRDGKARIWNSIGRAFARVFWVILLMIVGVLAMGAVFAISGLVAATGRLDAVPLATIIAIIIQIILAVMWCVAIPACVVERLGPIRSLGRSRELTQGHRWKLFAIFIITLLIMIFVSTVFSAVVRGNGAVVLIATVVFESILGAFWFVVPAVAYHDLRVVKEGVDIEKIASIFD